MGEKAMEYIMRYYESWGDVPTIDKIEWANNTSDEEFEKLKKER